MEPGGQVGIAAELVVVAEVELQVRMGRRRVAAASGRSQRVPVLAALIGDGHNGRQCNAGGGRRRPHVLPGRKGWLTQLCGYRL